jgi:outer membrane receptor protein involved in Fe transport
VVSAARAPVPVADLAVAVDLFSSARLQASPGRAVDAVLRESPAFSLFRRSGSHVANPTAQGVSLRGIGPSGASRSLVLLDGVPLNDPFGGWVAWGKVPTLALAGAEILRGGGSAEWGNAALGGTIALFTDTSSPAEAASTAVTPSPTAAASSSGRLRLSGGSAATAEGEWYAQTPVGRNAVVRTSLSALTTDGDFTLAPAQRGTVDRRLDLRQRLLQSTWRQRVGSASPLDVAITVRAFDEDRGNGTALQRNASREQFAAVAFTGRPSSALAWTANLYAQRQEFRSVFTSVDASRRIETPANDQFAVPSTAGGANATLNLRHPGAARAFSALGADVRVVRGETREDFLWSGNRFTRRRFAGGAQRFLGAFVTHERTLGERLRASAALRIDRWENTAGHRREWDSVTAASTRDDRFADREGTSLNPRIGVTLPLDGSGAPPNHRRRIRAAAYQAFRLPTLNEFHRPFRVGNVNTEANPLLAPERLTGVEAGADFPLGAARVSLTAFRQDLRDAVANVTLSRTPTLVSRQRRNLEAVRVDGIEVGLRGEPTPQWSWRVEALFSDATVRSAAVQPALEGRRLAQVPRFVGTAGLSWRAARFGTVDVRVRHTSAQYEDDENLLLLEPATCVDVQWSRSLARWLEGFITVENATQASLQTGRTVDGLISLDAPRRFRLGVRSQW